MDSVHESFTVFGPKEIAMNWQEALRRLAIVLSVPVILVGILVATFAGIDLGPVALVFGGMLAAIWAVYYAVIWIAAGLRA